MDLTHERRHLICAGRLFRTDSTFERKGMYELFVLLFDNYRAYDAFLSFPVDDSFHYSTVVITNIIGTGQNVKFQVYKRVGV